MSYIKRIGDHRGIRYQVSGQSVEETWFNIGRFGLVALTLKGHEEALFKKHPSFKGAKSQFAAPVKSASVPLNTIATLDLMKLKRQLSFSMTSLLEGIFRLDFSDAAQNNEQLLDKPYLAGVLSTFVNFPPLSYNEVHLEYHSSKELVGGSIDVIIGSESNGDKPYIHVMDNDLPSPSHKVAVYLGSLLEAKSAGQRLTPATSDAEETFDEVLEDAKVLIQPMLETMATAEMATFPNEQIPLLNIFGNKFVYRPLLYFRKDDIMLTTSRVVHLRKDATTVDTQGLLLLSTLFQLHKTKLCRFDKIETGDFPVTGWQAALDNGLSNYRNSMLIVAGVNATLPHATSKNFLHDDSDDEEDTRPKKREASRKGQT